MRTASVGKAFAAGWLACVSVLPAAAARGAAVPAPAVELRDPAPPASAEPAPAGSREQLWVRGEAAFRAGDLGEAARLFDAALASDRNSARSWNYVGGVHFAQGDYTRALQEFRRALELDPNDVRARNNLGTALERLGDYALAEAAYLQAARVDPAYALTLRNLGILQARRLGQPEAARASWRRFLELMPSGPYADEIRAELAALEAAAAPPPAR